MAKQTKKTSRRKRAFRDNLGMLLIILAVCAGVFVGMAFVFTVGTSVSLPTLPPPKQATIFYDMNQKEFARLYVENRVEVPFDKIPLLFKKSIVDVEDNRFYEHRGIDLRSIARAVWVDLRGGGYIEGGSTITQQLARNVLLTQKKAISRKIQEVFLAMSIERNYTKDEILERYLNQICFGQGAYGVEAAARTFFGKSVSELNLSEIALLTGLPKNPSGFSPFTHPLVAKERRATVLDQMVKYGSITPAEAQTAKNSPLGVIPLSPQKRRAAYFRDYVIQKLHGTIDEQTLYTGGYKIYTTLDILAQDAAEQAAASLNGGKPDEKGVWQPQFALTALDPKTGFIKAMIGGRDYGNTQLNRAVAAYRQPGSTIKPFVYTAALDSRIYTPSSILRDEPLSYPTDNGTPYTPHNYDNKFRGDITLRDALENSVNMIALKLVESLGPSQIVDYARRMGLKSLVVSGPQNDLNLASLALGGLTKGVTPLEMAAAYTPLANQGIYVEPVAVLEVKDAEGNTIFEDRPHKRIALSEETAYLMTDMMRGVIMRGTGQAAMIDRPAAGKTGTTSDNTNAWFIGYTPDLLAAVWIGNDQQNKPVRLNNTIIGSGKAAAIWGAFMRKALSLTPPSDFVPPAGIASGVQICAQSGELATVNCPETKYETYLSGTEPTTPCHLHPGTVINNEPTASPAPAADSPDSPAPQAVSKPLPANGIHKKRIAVKICTESGLLATPYCPERQVITEIFTEGEEPTASCNIHKK